MTGVPVENVGTEEGCFTGFVVGAGFTGFIGLSDVPACKGVTLGLKDGEFATFTVLPAV